MASPTLLDLLVIAAVLAGAVFAGNWLGNRLVDLTIGGLHRLARRHRPDRTEEDTDGQ